jgi:CHASE3 domain sensor protein
MPFGRGNRGVWVALAVALAMAVGDWYALSLEWVTRKHVRAQNTARQTLVEVERDVSDAVRQQRGYLITGRTEYLGDYAACVQSAKVKLVSLSEILSYNDRHANYLTHSLQEVCDLNEDMNETIQNMKTGMKPEAYRLVDSDRGHNAQKRIGLALDEIRAELDVDLTDSMARYNANRLVSFIMTVLFGVSAAGAVFLFVYRAKQYRSYMGY